MTKPLLILASSSPQRLNLLKLIGVAPDRTIPADINETPLKKELPKDFVLRMSKEKALEVKYNLERRLSMLGTIATISPLLGLLGTVVGMITAFTGLTESSGANPDLLAAGISQALITTAFGLMIAVPGLVLHRYFEQKITYLLITLQKEVSEFIDTINK